MRKALEQLGDQRLQVFAAELQLVGRPFGVTAAVVEQVDGHDGVLLTEQGLEEPEIVGVVVKAVKCKQEFRAIAKHQVFPMKRTVLD